MCAMFVFQAGIEYKRQLHVPSNCTDKCEYMIKHWVSMKIIDSGDNDRPVTIGNNISHATLVEGNI